MAKSKEWLQVFYKGELFIIHKDYKKELEKFLDERRTSIGYLSRRGLEKEVLH